MTDLPGFEERLFGAPNAAIGTEDSIRRVIAIEHASRAIAESGAYDLGVDLAWSKEPVLTPYSVAVRAALGALNEGTDRELQRIARGLGLDPVDLEARIRERQADIQDLFETEVDEMRSASRG